MNDPVESAMLLSLVDYETHARHVLAPDVYDYVAGGAGEERSVRRPREVLDGLSLRPRVLVDVHDVDVSTTVLGQRIALPVLIAPTGNHGIAHREAEAATVAAAGDIGTIMVVSSGSTLETATIAAKAVSPIWYQMYLYSDHGYTSEMARRAASLGFSAICLTVDALARPKRERDLRNGYAPPPSGNLVAIDDGGLSSARSKPALVARLDAAAGWDAIDRLRAASGLPVVIKGILAADDAEHCVDHGAAAVVVSAHGGRQLDTMISPVEALPDIAARIDRRIEVLVDGGFRQGTDIIKAIALGARAVLVGRPIFWGLATAGRAGVREVLGILLDELETAMISCGIPRLDSIHPDLLAGGSLLGSPHPAGGSR